MLGEIPVEGFSLTVIASRYPEGPTVWTTEVPASPGESLGLGAASAVAHFRVDWSPSSFSALPSPGKPVPCIRFFFKCPQRFSLSSVDPVTYNKATVRGTSLTCPGSSRPLLLVALDMPSTLTFPLFLGICQSLSCQRTFA